LVGSRPVPPFLRTTSSGAIVPILAAAETLNPRRRSLTFLRSPDANTRPTFPLR